MSDTSKHELLEEIKRLEKENELLELRQRLEQLRRINDSLRNGFQPMYHQHVPGVVINEPANFPRDVFGNPVVYCGVQMPEGHVKIIGAARHG